jgi:hypothetical protein
VETQSKSASCKGKLKMKNKNLVVVFCDDAPNHGEKYGTPKWSEAEWGWEEMFQHILPLLRLLPHDAAEDELDWERYHDLLMEDPEVMWAGSVKEKKERDLRALRNCALDAYRENIYNGLKPWKAVQSAWMQLRKEHLPHLRAPDAFNAVAHNGSSTRTFRAPIGEILEIPNADHWFGSYCTKWPRTQKSYGECAEVTSVVLRWFEENSNTKPYHNQDYKNALEEAIF